MRHTSVGASAVDVAVPQPDCLAVSDHAALSTPPPLFKRPALTPSAVQAPRSVRTHTRCCAPQTNDGDVFVTVMFPLPQSLNSVSAEFYAGFMYLAVTVSKLT